MTVCLIGGTGRSGTTVLTRLLARHPQLTNVPEWRFVVDPDGIVDFYRNRETWSPYHIDLRLRRLERVLSSVDRGPLKEIFGKLLRAVERPLPFKLTPAYATLSTSVQCPGFSTHVRTVMRQLTGLCHHGAWVGMHGPTVKRMRYRAPGHDEQLRDVLHEFLTSVMDEVKLRQGATHYLEKNTWNILWFDTLLELMPDARLVHIYRDPRDVVASFATQEWMPSSHTECAAIYDDLMAQWHKVKARVPADTYREYALESLVETPEPVLRKICRFWGLPWQPELANVDLGRAHSGRWRDEIPAPARGRVEARLAPWLQAYGYVP